MGHRFAAKSWPSDGRRPAGYQVRSDGTGSGIFAYSFDSRSYERLADFGCWPRRLSDSRRLLFNHQGKIYLVDSRTKKVCEILTLAHHEIDQWSLGLSRDD